MKQRLSSPGLKALLFLLTLFTAWCTLGGLLGVYALADGQVYHDGGTSSQEDIYRFLCQMEVNSALSHIREHWELPDEQFQSQFREAFPLTTCNCSLSITLKNRALTLTNGDRGDDSIFFFTDTIEFYHMGSSDAQETLTVRACLRPDYQSYDLRILLMQRLLDMRYSLPLLALFTFLLSLGGFVLLMLSAGHWNDYEGIHNTWFDRLPWDILLAVLLALFSLCTEASFLLGILLFALLLLPLGLLFLCSTASRCKTGSLLRYSLVGWCLRLLRRILRWTWQGLKALPHVWKAGLLLLGLTLSHIFCLLTFNSGDNPLALLELAVLDILAAAGALRLAAGYRRLELAGKKLADGHYESHTELTSLPQPLRSHGADLNAIRNGVQAALNREMKAERLRSELITNVSHDIKTPLTSIISYVDLLQGEKLTEPRVLEYLSVLERQSKRLKKLTEDLVELSKASSGSMPVSLQPTDVNVFLSQLEGEYAERLGNAGLQLVVTPAEADPRIQADPMLLYRVADNLMSNILKYALNGTRVYLSARCEEERVALSFKNVSREALNISPEELQERFVRGDNARSSEGSGLGLSIARSLTLLQCGSFELSIDGDLFRADLGFARLDEHLSLQ